MTRVNGAFLFLIIAQVCLRNAWYYKGDVMKCFPYLFTIVVSIGIVLAPLLMYLFVNPYEMHCDSKFESPYKLPEWCLSTTPNIYAYIQKTYWNAGFMEFLNRPGWQVEFLKALPTNLFSLYIIYKVINANHMKHFLTLGIFKEDIKAKEGEEPETYDVQESPFAIGLCWHYLFTFLMILIGANQEINTRILSISPLYILMLLDLLLGKESKTIEKYLGMIVAGWNLVQLVFNFVAFPLHVGFL